MAQSLLRGNWLYWPSLALRTDRVRSIRFRDGLPIILDLALLIDIAFADGTLRYTDVECFAYRRHAASLSQTALRDGSRFDDERRFYRDTAAAARARGWRRATRAARLRLMSRLRHHPTPPLAAWRDACRAPRARTSPLAADAGPCPRWAAAACTTRPATGARTSATSAHLGVARAEEQGDDGHDGGHHPSAEYARWSPRARRAGPVMQRQPTRTALRTTIALVADETL
jgi:hypothetical protein